MDTRHYRSYGLDLLISPRRRNEVLPYWANYHHLLSFAALRYDSILVDVPEVVNDATVEIVRRAERVFVICTPELASLALTLLRCEELPSRGIPADAIGVIVNRCHEGEIPTPELEKLLGCPVSAVLQNDYGAVSGSTRDKQLVDPKTPLGKSFAGFAGSPELQESVNPGFFKGLSTRRVAQLRA